MSELYKIILTSCVTLLGGIFLLIILKFFIEPIHEQRKLIGEILDLLIFYANEYANPGSHESPKMDPGETEASRALRRNATQLISKTNVILWYSLWKVLGFVRRREDIQVAYEGLIFLSNSISIGDPIKNLNKAKQITKCLGYKVKEEKDEEKGRAS